MASAYPAAKQEFTNAGGTAPLISPDHALYHGTIQDTLGSIQDTAGTTAGTNMLMHFAAGQFPDRVTGGGATGTAVTTRVGGTYNQATLGSPTVTGGTANNAVFGTPSITGGTFTMLNNQSGLAVRDSGGTARNAFKVDTSNRFEIGDIALKGGYLVNRCSVNHSALQSIANSVGTLAFDTDLYDPLGMHDPATNNSRITAPAAGVYRLETQFRWADSVAGTLRATRFLRNGTNQTPDWAVGKDAAGRSVSVCFTDKLLNANDYIEVVGLQDTGGTLGVNAGAVFSVSMIGTA